MKNWFGLVGCAVVVAGCAGGGGGGIAPAPSGLLLDTWNPYRATPLVAAATSASPPSNDAADLAGLLAVQASPSADAVAMADQFDVGTVQAWNAIARGLVASNKIDPPKASRLYAMLAIAQRDSALSAFQEQQRIRRTPPYRSHSEVARRSGALSPTFCCPSEAGAIAEASAAVLKAVIPTAAVDIDRYLSADTESRLTAGVCYPSDIDAGKAMGTDIGAQVLAHFASDGSDAVWSGAVPTGPGYWYSTTGTPPLRPLWGEVRTTVISSVDVIPVGPPPTFGSPTFLSALQEVRQISDTRTAEQTDIARKWADGAGTSTPPGKWNSIACNAFAGTVSRTDDMEAREGQVLAYMNMAMMDAGIVCWKAKYDYWLVRPSEVDTAITLPVGLPNFPSYTSGHSSFSGAAANVLSAALPGMGSDFQAMAEEAAISRVYGGIHYRFDSDEGLRCGRAIGMTAAQRMTAG